MYMRPLATSRRLTVRLLPPRLRPGSMGQPAPIPRRSSHLGSAACYGRSDHGSHSSTSAASSRSNRRQGNHNQFQTLKMFPDGHSASEPRSTFEEDPTVTASVHPAGPHHLPAFFTAPGETDVLMIGVAVFLVIAVVTVGILFLRLHTLPERIAHKSHKLQFE